MGIADLHIHSNQSDGDWPPEKVVSAAAHAGLKAIALTDHDSVAGVPRAMACGRDCGVEVLSGIEISTLEGEVDVHILGYGFDPAHPEIAELQKRLRTVRLRRAEEIVERLGELGVPVSLDAVLEYAGEGGVGRPHLARALVESGWVYTYREAFDRYLGDGRPACIPKDSPAPVDAIAMVHRAGGAAVSAHPGVYGPPEWLDFLVEAGLDGVEVRHSLHDEDAERAFAEYAAENDLVMTGGSDFHGPRGAHSTVGAVTVPQEWLDALKERIRRWRSDAGEAETSPKAQTK